MDLVQRTVSISNQFVCHNKVEADRLRVTYGFDEVTILAEEIPRYWPDKLPPQPQINKIIEKYSAIPLSRVMWSDTFELGKKEPWATKNLLAHIHFWDSYLTKNRIDALVIEVPSILSTCAAWVVCQTLGVRTISPIDIAPLGNRMVLSRSWQGYYPGFNEGADPGKLEDQSSEAQEYARNYLARMTERPELTPQVRRRRSAGAYEGMSWGLAFKKIPGYFARKRAKRAYYIHSAGEYWFRRWAKALPNLLQHRVFHLLRNPSSKELDRPYYLMPLHEPNEWSNYTWMGPRYANIEPLIREIAASLPPGFELLVKEHSSGFGLRPLSFYRTVRKIPRVRLIHPYSDGFALLKKSAGVVTLGSSMGWEAWLLDKPAILLGEPWYWRIPQVRRARNAEELAFHLQDSIDAPKTPKETKLAMVARLFDLSFEATKYPDPDALTDTNVRRWADAIERDLETIQA